MKHETLISFSDEVTFSFVSLPFAVASKTAKGIEPVTTSSILYTAKLQISPQDVDWKKKLLAGESVLVKGIRAGTREEEIEMNMRAEQQKQPANRIHLYFDKP